MHDMSIAHSGYAVAGKEARVLNANAHELVNILFEELLNLLDEIHLIYRRGQSREIVDQQVMALTIVDSLMASLDMKKGGNLAKNLHLLYGQVRQLIASREPKNLIRNNRAAHRIMSEIFSAWSEIG